VPARLRVPRVAAPVPEFRSRYVATRQPVLIDGLFDGQPIRMLATPRAACRVGLRGAAESVGPTVSRECAKIDS
jgi:hypothetical protein